MSIISLLFHALIDFFIGLGILRLFSKEPFTAEHYFSALIMGILVETTVGFWLLWAGVNISVIAIIPIVLAIGLNGKYWQSTLTAFKDMGSGVVGLKNAKWYEWLFIVLLLEKVMMILWQLLRMPTYHSDSIRHWSIQARALYGGTNWSMEQGADFLAKKFFVVMDYPMQVTIWRAISATYNFEWNEFVSRSDGLIFYIGVCGLVGALFYKFTNKRWIALGAAFIVASLPLQVWQAASGYTDIAVEVYLVAAVAAFIRKEWWLCGLFMAGTIWSKNEGFAIYVPSMILAGLMYTLFSKSEIWKDKFKIIGQFIGGLAIIFPWLVFQAIHGKSVLTRIIKPLSNMLSDSYVNDYQVVLVQTGKKFQDAKPSYQLFWDYVITGPSHGIFWLMILIGLIAFAKYLWKDIIGRSLFICLLAILGLNYYVFTYTPAYEFLMIQTTVHRVFLQFYAMALVLVGYGLSLYLKAQPISLLSKQVANIKVPEVKEVIVPIKKKKRKK